MNSRSRSNAVKLARRLLPADEMDRLEQLRTKFKDTGFGYDIFGYEWESGLYGYLVARTLYKYYFRAEGEGIENVPTEGRAVMASNHAGITPMDAVTIVVDCVQNCNPPRMPRAVIEKMFTKLPYADVIMKRLGQVIGVRGNFEELLKNDEIVLVFPEGARGMGKTFPNRYQLVKFNVGFVELAIEQEAPIIPVAVVGSEEQAPIIFNYPPLGKLLGTPVFPITPTWPLLGPIGLIPLPTKYYIRYGEPLNFHKTPGKAALSDAATIKGLADQVRAKVQEMLDEMLPQRGGIFLGKKSPFAAAKNMFMARFANRLG